MIRSCADDTDFDPVFGVPLQNPIKKFKPPDGSKEKTYAGVAIENVHIIPGIEVIYGTFTVDFESVYPGG